MRVLVPLAEGLEEIEAVTIIDVLRRAEVEVVSAALGQSREVCGAHGVTLLADTLWPADGEFDAIVLPGGGKGTENLGADARVLQMLREFDGEGKFVAAICAAPLVLAAAGLLRGRRATCYPSCYEELGEAYDDMPVVADGNIITGQGPGCAMLFALVLIEHFVDEPTARRVAEGLLTAID